MSLIQTITATISDVLSTSKDFIIKASSWGGKQIRLFYETPLVQKVVAFVRPILSSLKEVLLAGWDVTKVIIRQHPSTSFLIVFTLIVFSTYYLSQRETSTNQL